MDRIDHKIGTKFEAVIKIPMNLTGFTVASAISSAAQRHELTAVVVDPGPELASIRVSATSAQTEQWKPGAYAWDIALIDAQGEKIAFPATFNQIVYALKGATV